MKMHYGKVVLITGASSGIGRSCAEYMAGLGYKVYGTSRRTPEANTSYIKNVGSIAQSESAGSIAQNEEAGSEVLESEVKRNKVMGNTPEKNEGSVHDKYGITMIRMDVCNDESVKAAIDNIIELEGEIGIVVNNAGMGIAGAVEDTSPQEVFMQMDTNFFGVHRVIRQVLPHMRRQGRGLIINMSSVGAVFPIPYQSMYVASKAAVEGMTGSLRNELRPFGIKVAYVEPGDTKTGFTSSRVMANESGEGSAYLEYCKKSIAVMEKDETSGPNPVTVAKVVARLASRKNPPVCVTVGLQYKLFVFLRRLVPKALESFVVSKMYEG